MQDIFARCASVQCRQVSQWVVWVRPSYIIHPDGSININIIIILQMDQYITIIIHHTWDGSLAPPSYITLCLCFMYFSFLMDSPCMVWGLNLGQKGVLISRIPLCGTTRIVGGKHYNYTDYAHCTLCNGTRTFKPHRNYKIFSKETENAFFAQKAELVFSWRVMLSKCAA